MRASVLAEVVEAAFVPPPAPAPLSATAAAARSYRRPLLLIKADGQLPCQGDHGYTTRYNPSSSASVADPTHTRPYEARSCLEDAFLTGSWKRMREASAWRLRCPIGPDKRTETPRWPPNGPTSRPPPRLR
jgi:hypothetical protein